MNKNEFNIIIVFMNIKKTIEYWTTSSKYDLEVADSLFENKKYHDVPMVTSEIRGIIRRFAEAIENEGITIQKIFLYGSYSRGEERKYSDIDVAVVSKDFEEDTIEANMKLLRIAVRVDVRLAPLAIAQSELVNLHIPIIGEAQKGIDMTFAAA